MRLICPNCGAQYEVPTNVIPTGGRDVQCSNCGHTWFQAHPEDLPPEPETGPDSLVREPERADEPAPVIDPVIDPEPEPAPPPDPERKPRSLDPSVLEVLREEAELEQRQRAAEAGSLETQGELGLGAPDEDEAARHARESRQRMARMKGEPPETDPAAARTVAATAAAASSRRELLPDIEEINQTLRAAPDRRSGSVREMTTPQGRLAAEEEQSAERSGFARGFRVVVLVAVLAAALYVIAPMLIDMVPALGSVLGPYVDVIDGLRIRLDGQVIALLQMLDAVSSEAPAQ